MLYGGWDFLIYLIFDPGIFPSAPVIPYEARCLGTRLTHSRTMCKKANEQSLKRIWLFSTKKQQFLNTSGYQTWRGIWWKPLLPGTTCFFVLSKDFITGRDHFFKWDLITCRCGPFLVSTKNHQRIQAPNFEGFLNLRRLFRRWGFPYIGRIHTAYIAEYLHFGYLKCLLKHLFFGDLPRFATFGWFFTWWRCSGERPFFRVRSRGTLLGVCELWIVGAK